MRVFSPDLGRDRSPPDWPARRLAHPERNRKASGVVLPEPARYRLVAAALLSSLHASSARLWTPSLA